MPDPAEIRSEAQRAMFAKAAADPAYAAQRGFSPEFAQACLDHHAKSEKPALPDRIERRAAARPGAAPAPATFLQSRRAE